MRDIIDLGNSVFDRLIQAHGEIGESRILFLYSITQGTTWTIINSDKIISVTTEGVSSNFEDQIIQELHLTWINQVQTWRNTKAQIEKKKVYQGDMNPNFEELIPWGENETSWREVTAILPGF